MNLVIMDYLYARHNTGIPLNTVNEVDVTVISGDELFVVLTSTGEIKRFDAANFSGVHRVLNTYDGSYIVRKEDVEKWNNRKDTYEYISAA